MAKSMPMTGASAARGKQQAGGSRGKAGGNGTTARSGGGAAGQTNSGRRGAAGGGVSARGQEGERITGTPDEHYNLVSVLYHSLKGAETYEQYIEDAEEAGDAELASFFKQVKDEEQVRAERAKALLLSRIGGGGMSGDEEE